MSKASITKYSHIEADQILEKDIWYNDNVYLKQILKCVLTSIPSIIVDVFRKDVFFISPNDDGETFHFDVEGVAFRKIIVLKDTILFNIRFETYCTLLHEMSHVYLCHNGKRFHGSSDEQYEQEEDEAKALSGLWGIRYIGIPGFKDQFKKLYDENIGKIENPKWNDDGIIIDNNLS